MYGIFEKLCNENNITPYKVHKATGIARSTLSDWKNGISTPKQDKLKLIADYFNVSVDYLMTGKESGLVYEIANTDIELTMMSNTLKEYALKLSKLKKDDQELLMQMIDRLTTCGG